MTSRLILLRHGETAWNAENRFQGQADEPLNEAGWAQARAAAPVVVALGIDELWSSPLSRALQTASEVAKLAGLPMQIDERLREISVGSWSGRLASEIAASEPDYLAKFLAGEDFRRSSTGETEAEVGDRVLAALEAIAPADGRTVCVVGHGFALRAGMARLLGLPANLAITLGTLHNCHYSIVEVGRPRARLIVHNAAADLARPTSNVHPAQ